jgi:hypothetical protein
MHVASNGKRGRFLDASCDSIVNGGVCYGREQANDKKKAY